MASPGLLLLLDRLARRYGTDPGAVMGWDPDRIALAVACLDQADATLKQMADRGGTAFPVVIVGQAG